MNYIKNRHLLADTVSTADQEMMEQAGRDHLQYSNITFKIIEVQPKSVTIRAAQGRNAAGNYHPAKRLIEIVHETFDRFFPGRKIHVHPQPYTESPAMAVDASWIRKQMEAHGVKLKDLAAETGLNQTWISGVIGDTRPLSDVTRALFYFYFQARALTYFSAKVKA